MPLISAMTRGGREESWQVGWKEGDNSRVPPLDMAVLDDEIACSRDLRHGSPKVEPECWKDTSVTKLYNILTDLAPREMGRD